MAETTINEQIVREAPQIEAYKLGLLQSAKGLADRPVTLPGYQVAGFNPDQIASFNAARQGIGAYQPYLGGGAQALQQGLATTGEAANVLRGADTRNQFGAAQQAMNMSGQAANQMAGAAGMINPAYQALNAANQYALGSDTSGQFGGAYGLLGQGAGLTGFAAQQAQQAATQPGFALGQIGTAGALGDIDYAQRMGLGYRQANLNQAQQAMGQGLAGTGRAEQAAYNAAGVNLTPAQQALQQAQQQAFGSSAANYGQAQGLMGQGIGQLVGGARQFNPSSIQAFMNPYQQQVIDATMAEMNRQQAIAQQGLNAQAVRAGAFGGTREGIQRAEMERNVQQQKAQTIASLLNQGYTQAAQQAQAAFESQQGRQQAAGQGIGQQAALAGQLATQQAQLGQQGAQTAGQLAAQQGQLGLAGGQLGLSAAQTAGSLAGQGANIGQALGAQQLQQTQLGQSAAQLYGQQAAQQGALAGQQANIASQQGQLGLQGAGLLGNLGAQYGQFAGQQGALAGQQSAIQQQISQLLAQQAATQGNLAGQQAGIYGQQAGTYQNLGQGIGALAGQQFGVGQQMAQGLGQFGGQLGNLGVQQAALGQTAQQLGQGDVNFLYNIGQQQQGLTQQQLDAQRNTALQNVYEPYQRLGFLSDIYKGAPTSQQSITAATAPTPTAMQQAAGLGIAGLSAAAAGKKAGLF